MGSDLLDTAAAAKELKVTPARVRALIKAGRLKAEMIGRDYVIRIADLDPVRKRVPGRPKGGSHGKAGSPQRKSPQRPA